MATGSSVPESAAGHGSPLRSGLNLQLRSHASPKPPIQECPMCPYSSDSPLRLEEHINRQHFDLTSPSFPPEESPPSREGVFNCPLCITSFPNSSDLELHVNIEHKDILRYFPKKRERNKKKNTNQLIHEDHKNRGKTKMSNSKIDFSCIKSERKKNRF